MGPYCKFCGQRCFVRIPENTPAKFLKPGYTFTILATCKAGQEFEKQRVGFCYDDIKKATEEPNITEM